MSKSVARGSRTAKTTATPTLSRRADRHSGSRALQLVATAALLLGTFLVVSALVG